MHPGLRIERVNGFDIRAGAEELADFMAACVALGRSLGFLHPINPLDAVAFWRAIAHEVDDDTTLCLAAVLEDALIGTVHVRLILKPNRPKRVDFAKPMVKPAHRRRAGTIPN